MMTGVYGKSFYESQGPGSLSSARAILKTLNDTLSPKSVVDVGCGIGTWLKAWFELGVDDVFGIDGDYVSRDQLLIPIDRFMPMDLSAPTKFSRRFDLVESLEVAEHLPHASAEDFVSFLCSLGSVVLFSAAVPGQGGTNHINEQWPEYWVGIFQRQGFVLIDTLRDCIWNNPDIEYWYCQNVVLFVRAECTAILEQLKNIASNTEPRCLSRVHPRMWLAALAAKEQAPGLRALLKMFPKSLAAAVRRRLQWTA